MNDEIKFTQPFRFYEQGMIKKMAHINFNTFISNLKTKQLHQKYHHHPISFHDPNPYPITINHVT